MKNIEIIGGSILSDAPSGPHGDDYESSASVLHLALVSRISSLDLFSHFWRHFSRDKTLTDMKFRS
jgi:hypothetical protein